MHIPQIVLAAAIAIMLVPAAHSADKVSKPPKAEAESNATTITGNEVSIRSDDGEPKQVISNRRVFKASGGDSWSWSSGSSLGDNEPKGPVTYLGIAAEAVTDDLAAHLPVDAGVGLIVRTVGQDSPAAAAGVQPNDVLLKIDDQLLIQPRQMQILIRNRKEGDTVTLTFLRKGETKTGKATLVKRDPPTTKALVSENPEMERLNDLIQSAGARTPMARGSLPLFQKQTVIVGPDGKVTRLGEDIDVDRIRRDVEKELQKAGMADDVRKQVSEALKKAESSIKKAEAEAKKTAEDATKAAADARRKK